MTHTPCPHTSLVWPFWINKDPGVCYKCVHTTCSVCVCVCVCVCMCTQNLQLCAAEEGSHKMMGISKLGCSCWGSLCIVCFLFSSPRPALLSVLSPLILASAHGSNRGFEESRFISAYTNHPWKHNSVHDWCICVRSTFMNSKYGTRFQAVDIHLVRHVLSHVIGWGRAAPPNSHEGSGAEGESARGEEEI